tara:strand:+ start:572 stop:1723 length:1152 start_codon:yes stop_codon:yes gene_type:complete
MNKRGTMVIVTVFEIIIVALVIFMTFQIAHKFATSETSDKIILSNDIKLMVNTLIATPGNVVVEYPGDVSRFNFILSSESVSVFTENSSELTKARSKFFLPQGFIALGSLEQKEKLCLVKDNKRIILEECSLAREFGASFSGLSTGASGEITEIKGRFSSYAEAEDWIRQASVEQKIGLLGRGGKRGPDSVGFIVLHDGGKYGSSAVGVNTLLTDWALRNTFLPELEECRLGSSESKPLCEVKSVSSHYYIDCDGTITPLIPEEQIAYHVGCKGNNPKCYLPGTNKKSIGIDIRNCNLARGTYVTEAQYDNLNILIDDISSRYPNVLKDDEHILAHFEVYSGHNDPLPEFIWEKVGLTNHRSNEYCLRHLDAGMCYKKGNAVG